MIVTFETPNSPTEGILTIKVEQTDYQPRVDKKLKEAGSKVALKGFRPGKVPMQLVKQMYGQEILLKELNDVLQDAISEYLTNNPQHHVLGSPVPIENSAFDLKRPETFVFAFKCGMVAPFEYDLNKLYVKSYDVIVDDEAVDKIITRLQLQYGKADIVETISADAIVKGALYDTAHDYSAPESRVMDEDENDVTSFYMEVHLPMTSVSEQMLPHFMNATVGTIVHFDIKELMADSEKGLHLLTGKSQAYMDSFEGDFAFEVQEISSSVPAELNEEFFVKILPDSDVKTEDEFRATVKKIVQDDYAHQSNHLKEHEIRDQLLANTHLELPHDFLKAFLIERDEKLTAENIEEHYPEIEKNIRWDVITSKIAQDLDLKVTSQEVYSAGYRNITNMYGQLAHDPKFMEYMKETIKEYVQKNYSSLTQNIMAGKVTNSIIENTTPVTQIVSEVEFADIYNSFDHNH